MDKIELEKILQDIGFNEKESRVFLTLLQLNEALPSSISRLTQIKRPTTYLILENLEKKGLVSHIKRSGNLYFQACKPEYLIEKQRELFKKSERQLNELEKILPELNLLRSDSYNTPQMSVYRGKEGLIQIMEDTLTVKDKMLYCWSNIELNVFTLLKDYYPTYISKKIHKKVFLKGVFNYSNGALRFKQQSKNELREVYLISEEKFPIHNEINIYDDKISIISPTDQVGVIIQNSHIANTQRSIFKLAFEYAKILEKDLLTKEDEKYLSSKKEEDDLSKHIKLLA